MTLDIILMVFAFLLITGGMAGSFLPALPGPPLAYAGLLLTLFTQQKPVSTTWIIVYGFMVLAVLFIDYMLPAWSTKWTKGTPAGARGAMIGSIAGVLLPIPLGIFIGGFIGAVIGELLTGKTIQQAIIAGIGTFAGFIAGMIMKFLLCLVMGLHLLFALLL